MERTTKSDIFRFKQFEVSNCRSAMKVGTDGVLLGAWCPVPDKAELKVLDVGCGTGILSLMIAQRATAARIIGIEIDPEGAEEARSNVANSPFAPNISIIQGDFLAHDFGDERFDLIISNPPFFNETLQSPDKRRSVARHEESLPTDALLAKCAKILADDGIMAMIAPTGRSAAIDFAATMAGLTATCRCEVVTMPGKPSKRTLWEFRRKETATAPIVTTLAMRTTDGDYSAEYKQLTYPYLLNLK